MEKAEDKACCFKISGLDTVIWERYTGCTVLPLDQNAEMRVGVECRSHLQSPSRIFFFFFWRGGGGFPRSDPVPSLV